MKPDSSHHFAVHVLFLFFVIFVAVYSEHFSPLRLRLTHTVLFIKAAAALSNTVCDCLADAIILALYLHNHIIISAQLGT